MMVVWRAVAGILMAIIAIGGLWWLGASAMFRPLAPAAPSVSAPNAHANGAAAATPMGVEVRPTDSGSHVYACRQGSERVYADHPCGKDAAVQSLDPARLNLYHAVPAPVTSFESAAVPETPVVDPAASNVPGGSSSGNECALIEAQIRTIDERTRRPYSAQEGEELRQHRHRLEAERWRLRCGWE